MSGEPAGAFQDQTSRWSAELPRSRGSGPAAWVQIVAGCSNFCSYCIVPYVRGPEASRPAAAILAEVRALAAAGVRQVTFLGQNVNAYGKEPGFAGPGELRRPSGASLLGPGYRAGPFHDLASQGHVRPI